MEHINKGNHPGFETQGRSRKSGISAPTKRTGVMVYKKYIKKKRIRKEWCDYGILRWFVMYIIFKVQLTNRHCIVALIDTFSSVNIILLKIDLIQ